VTQLDGGNRPVRLLGVSVSNLLSRDEMQRTGRVTALPLWVGHEVISSHR
jgi:hypothetical protein